MEYLNEKCYINYIAGMSPIYLKKIHWSVCHPAGSVSTIQTVHKNLATTSLTCLCLRLWSTIILFHSTLLRPRPRSLSFSPKTTVVESCVFINDGIGNGTRISTRVDT